MDMMYIQKNFTEIKKKGSNVRLWELEFKIEWTETVENEQNQWNFQSKKYIKIADCRQSMKSMK